MGFFSNIFKTKNKTVVETPLGIFTLNYSKGIKNIWTSTKDEVLLSVRGSSQEPDTEQLSFVEKLDDELQKIDSTITDRFIDEFTNADLEVDFSHWKKRFKIVAVEVMLIFEGDGYWNITFEDNTELTHFTLYIEGLKTTDFSIDT